MSHFTNPESPRINKNCWKRSVGCQHSILDRIVWCFFHRLWCFFHRFTRKHWRNRNPHQFHYMMLWSTLQGKENHLQKCLGRGLFSFQQGICWQTEHEQHEQGSTRIIFSSTNIFRHFCVSGCQTGWGTEVGPNQVQNASLWRCRSADVLVLLSNSVFMLPSIWPNGIIFHQPGFPWNKKVSLP